MSSLTMSSSSLSTVSFTNSNPPPTTQSHTRIRRGRNSCTSSGQSRTASRPLPTYAQIRNIRLDPSYTPRQCKRRMSTHLAHWSGTGHTQSSLTPVRDVDEDSELASAHCLPDKSSLLIQDTVRLAPPAFDSFASLHRHRDSVSTTTSDSATSSPTTTASLVDSHSIGETPSASPDTPASNHSLAGYPSLSAQLLANPPARLDATQPPGSLDLPRPSPPSRKGRNLKNLAVDTSSSLPLGRAISTATLPLQHLQPQPKMSAFLAPATPGFVKPSTPRKKGNGLGLTIQTQNNSKEDGSVPPTPSLIRPASLRHYQSSPSLNVFSAKYGPDGGMKLPSISTARKTVAVGFADAPLEHEEDEERQNFDVPQSREEKPESYPDGPICIYDPHVYLYYEPTAEEASHYDVIFNVASEVKNPFYGHAKDLEAAERDPLPNLRRRASSPSTPKASDLSRVSSLPEYIHIPWEHNTDIVPDLHRLVKIVDDRVQQGKRVLIHCQCGVSRSASLIVAYGLYKNPSITVQEAYDAVKRRSKWIGPNMNLIMQLQEFRSGLLRADAGVSKPVSKASLMRPSLNRSQSAQGEQFVKTHSRLPKSAPLAPEDLPTVPPAIMTAHPGGAEHFILPGPSSAPSGYQWPLNEEPRIPTHDPLDGTSQATAANDQTSMSDPERQDSLCPSQISMRAPRRIEPPRLEVQLPSATDNASPSLFSPRGAEFNMTSTLPPAVEDGFGLTSPRNATFTGLSASPAVRPLEIHQPRAINHQRFDSSAMSPRTEEFHMTPFNPRPAKDDDGLGLTSPRGEGFPRELPTRPKSNPPASEQSRIRPILPSALDAASSQQESKARAELGSILGLSRRSNYDLRAAFHSGTTTMPAATPRQSAPKLDTVLQSPAEAALPSFEASLLSPREATFTDNPFNEAAQAGTSRPAKKEDPRSPPQKGASPIIRSIFDVL